MTTRRQDRRGRALLIGLLLAGLTTALASEAGAQAGYRIGMTAAITGRAGDTYAPTYEAYKAYFKKVNDAGGIKGRPVEILYEDDRGEPSRAAAAAKKFVHTDRVILVVNASISATYKPVLAEALPAKIPVMFGGGVCPREAFPPADPLIFCSTSFGAKFDSLFAIGFIKEMSGGRRVKAGFAAQDIPLSRAELEIAEGLAREQGMETIPVVVVPGATADFTPFAAKLKDAGADWVFSWGLWHVEVGVFEALNRLGWKGRYLLYGHHQTRDELARIKADNLFAFGGNALITEALPLYREMRQAVQQAGATYPVHHMAEGWVSAMMLEAALRACGWPCDREKLVRAMGNISVDTKGLRGGPIEWMPTNHYRKTSYYKVYRWDRPSGQIITAKDWTKIEIR